MNNILYCQPIFAPDLMRLNKNIDSIESINNYIIKNNIKNDNIKFIFGGWCLNDEYWNILSTKINDYFNVSAIRFDKNYGKAYVVNSLVALAETKLEFEYILTLDSDIMFDINEPNIFERLITCADSCESIRGIPFGLIALNQSVGNCHIKNVYENKIEIPSNYGIEQIVYPNGNHGIAGGCLFIKFKSWKLVGGYRVMGVYAGDDAYMLIDLIDKGMSIQMSHTISCIHPFESDNNYAQWKISVARREHHKLTNESLEINIKEADEFWQKK